MMAAVVMGAGLIASGCGDQQSPVGSALQETKPAVQLQESVPPAVAPAANDMVKQTQDLLARAKQYLDEGKLDEAISMAQEVLKFDPANVDAKNIIEMAKEKLKAMAQQKAGDVKSGVMGALGVSESK